MPGMNGIQFLSQVMKIKPEITRIILSGQSDEDEIIKSIEIAHQFLVKPCSIEKLKEVIIQTNSLHQTLNNNSLKKIISSMTHIPSISSLYKTLLEEVQSGDLSADRIGEIIARDIGLTIKILKFINSAYFALNRKIYNPKDAVTYLGLDTIKSLVLSLEIFSQYEQDPSIAQELEAINNHCLAVAAYAQKIAKIENDDKIFMSMVFTSGLLHDVGKLLIYINFKDKWDEFKQLLKQMTYYEAEIQLFGASHAEVGAYLMGLWGLPDLIIECINYHHNPLACPNKTFSPLTLIHFADVTIHHLNPDGAIYSGYDQQYLQNVNFESKKDTWREMYKTMNVK